MAAGYDRTAQRCYGAYPRGLHGGHLRGAGQEESQPAVLCLGVPLVRPLGCGRKLVIKGVFHPCHLSVLSSWTLGGSGMYGEGLFLRSYSLKTPTDGHGPQTSLCWGGTGHSSFLESFLSPPQSLLKSALTALEACGLGVPKGIP